MPNDVPSSPTPQGLDPAPLRVIKRYRFVVLLTLILVMGCALLSTWRQTPHPTANLPHWPATGATLPAHLDLLAFRLGKAVANDRMLQFLQQTALPGELRQEEWAERFRIATQLTQLHLPIQLNALDGNTPSEPMTTTFAQTLADAVRMNYGEQTQKAYALGLLLMDDKWRTLRWRYDGVWQAPSPVATAAATPLGNDPTEMLTDLLVGADEIADGVTAEAFHAQPAGQVVAPSSNPTADTLLLSLFSLDQAIEAALSH
jgi:hypothetical protein